MDRTAQRSDARRHRKRLIEAAARVFARDGADAPLENVLVEAELGRGTLYRHFKDRQSLAAATLELPVEELQRFVEDHADDRTLLWRFLLQHRHIASLYHASSIMVAAAPQQKEFVKVQSTADDLYRKVIQRSVSAGVVSAGTTIRDLRMVMRLLIGLDMRGEDSLQAGALMEGAVHLLIRGLANS